MTEHELFHTYNKDVYRTCLYMLKNSQDAEDVCHDVFVTVFRQNWSGVTHLRAWIMRITMNHCLNVIRKNKTRTMKQEQVNIQFAQEADAAASVENIVLAKDSLAEMEEQLAKLPDKLLAVITLRYIGDLTVPEIAETLHIPQGTVRSRLHKALRLMRSRLERRNKYTLRGEDYIGSH